MPEDEYANFLTQLSSGLGVEQDELLTELDKIADDALQEELA